jgi:hypothetical protein
MKQSKIIIGILAVLLVLLSVQFTYVKLENDRIQKNIDETFTNSYHNLTLNLLNQSIEGIGEDAIHRYHAENTKWSAIMINYYHLTSFQKYKNADLNTIIAILAQSSGYNRVTELDMSLDLYHKIKDVPNDSFGNEDILREAKEAIENALIEK